MILGTDLVGPHGDAAAAPAVLDDANTAHATIAKSAHPSAAPTILGRMERSYTQLDELQSSEHPATPLSGLRGGSHRQRPAVFTIPSFVAFTKASHSGGIHGVRSQNAYLTPTCPAGMSPKIRSGRAPTTQALPLRLPGLRSILLGGDLVTAPARDSLRIAHPSAVLLTRQRLRANSRSMAFRWAETPVRIQPTATLASPDHR